MRTLRNLIVIATGTLLMTNCQIYSTVKDFTDREEGRLTTIDGQEYTGRVLMPKGDTKNVHITLADGTKQEVKSENVKVLEVWKKTHPDKVHPLIVRKYFRDYRAKKPYGKLVWMAPFFVGKHLMICAMSGKYSIPSDGALTVSSYQNGDVIWVAVKTNNPIGMRVGGTSDGYRYTRKALAAFLADDPVLCKRIETMKMRTDEEWQTIVDEYQPGRK